MYFSFVWYFTSNDGCAGPSALYIGVYISDDAMA